MLLVSLPLLISYLWSTSGTYQPFLEIIYNTLGFILFLTVGSLALDHYRNYAGYNETVHHGNTRGDIRGGDKWTGEDKWVANQTNSWSDSYTGRALGFNNTENVSAGKALGVIILNRICFFCLCLLITAIIFTLQSLCIINAFFYLTDAALALRQGSTV